jgi:hypothetical protein
MHKEIDVTELPTPLIEAIDSIVPIYREESATATASSTATRRLAAW